MDPEENSVPGHEGLAPVSLLPPVSPPAPDTSQLPYPSPPCVPSQPPVIIYTRAYSYTHISLSASCHVRTH